MSIEKLIEYFNNIKNELLEEQSQEIIDAVRQYERDNAGSDLSSFFDEGSNVDSDMLNAVQF